jgi:predicted transposase/invertase (TIGR01784 family)
LDSRICIAIGEERSETRGELKGKRETAHTMLAKGLSIEIASECTGLTIDEIKAIN